MMLKSYFFMICLGVSLSENVPFSFLYKKIQLPTPSPAYRDITKAILPQPTAIPNYGYKYIVEDPHSGDLKTQEETRQGDVVRGSYSFLEADGSRRIVEYFADSKHGFNAVVRRLPNFLNNNLLN